MSGKVAIVVGGSSGIGAATALELAKRGWRVAIVFSRDQAAADAAVRECGEAAFALRADVTVDADCRRAATEVRERCGRIDALVNSAGTTKRVAHANLEGLSAEDFERISRTNVVGPFQMVRACAEALKAAQGAIVNVSSLAGVMGTGSSVAYAASKAALNAMTLSLARSLAPEVRVNTVCPGYVRTQWWLEKAGKDVAAEVERRYVANAPLRRVAEPQDVADAIVWLIEGARCVTGEILLVDAGMHIATPR